MTTPRTLVGPANPPPVPAGFVLRTVADAVVAKRRDDGSPLTISDLVAAYNAQIPKLPEPEEFGSIVRAETSDYNRMLWHPSPMHGKHYWESETGAVEVWSELTDVVVLRIGLGEPREGFCSCYSSSEKALDCGVSGHRREARVYRDPMDDGPERRFCTRSQNCRMAEGHEGGCQS